MEVEEGRKLKVSFVVRGLGVGRWGIYVDGNLVGEKNVTEKGEDVRDKFQMGMEDLDVVVLRF